MSYSAAPYDFQDININLAHGTPNQAYLPSAIYDYWVRSLYQRLTSVFEWTVPDNWEGSKKDFLFWLLYNVGFVGVIDTVDYGVIFQPCTLGADRDVMYQANSFIVTNPYDSDISKTYTLGKDGELLKLTPDFRGVCDIVTKYASRLSFLYRSINTSIINAKVPPIFIARNKTGAKAIDVIQSKIYNGEPYVILDKTVVYMNEENKEDGIFILEPNKKDDFIVDKLLECEETIIKEFDQEVGIPTISEKKERLVTSEAETKVIDGTARSLVWFDCLKDSIDRIKRLFPGITLDVSLRYDSSNTQENTGEEANDVHDSNTEGT